MVINGDNKSLSSRVRFVDYSGRFPNLCNGVLILEIDGEDVAFGHETEDFDYKNGVYRDNNYDEFWSSGGSCSFSRDWEGNVSTNEWKIDVSELPDKYKPLAYEIDRVFNDNVPWGCCGGCL